MPHHDRTLPPSGLEQDGSGSGLPRTQRNGVDAASAAERLKTALRRAPARHTRGYEAAMGDIRAAVHDLVDALHDSGVAPEKVLVRVKEHVAAHASDRADLLDGAVRWCIARYYNGAGNGDGAARLASTVSLK